MASLIKIKDDNGNIINIPILQGPRGKPGKLTNVTASIDDTIGTPSVAVTLGGTEEERTLDLAFSGLKGEPGEGAVASVNGKTGTVVLTANDVGALPSTTSGVTAGSYGPTGAVTSGSFNVPQVTVDTYGRVTKVTNRSVTLPSSVSSVAASKVTAGTLGGKVQANATAAATLGNAQVRDIIISNTDLTAGTSELATGTVYLVYE